jgi:hypothetical protein
MNVYKSKNLFHFIHSYIEAAVGFFTAFEDESTTPKQVVPNVVDFSICFFPEDKCKEFIRHLQRNKEQNCRVNRLSDILGDRDNTTKAYFMDWAKESVVIQKIVALCTLILKESEFTHSKVASQLSSFSEQVLRNCI